jgi:hypothetical protein
MSYNVYLCSRNQSTGELSIENYTSYVESGVSFVDKLGESLDIGQVTFRNLSSSDPFDLFDWIEVYNGTRATGTLIASQRIAGDNVSVISKNPLRYEHGLSLVEHTKILERFIISGKTFRQPTGLTSSKTLYDIISDLRNTTPLELGLLVSDSRPFEMPDSSTALYTILNDTVAPEFTFKDVTLREALNEIFGFIEAIPRLFINSSGDIELGADFVNELNALIASENDFTEKNVQQDATFYATQMESDALNIVNQNDINESTEIYPANGTFTTGRTDRYTYNFLDSYIPTPKRISQVTSLRVKPLTFLVNTVVGTTVAYNSDLKFLYYNSSYPRPTTGVENVYYVDMDDSEVTYEWDGTQYNVSGTYPDTSLADFKVRLIPTFALFSSTLNPTVTTDPFVDRSTGKAYRYNGSSYVEVDCIGGDGELIVDVTSRVVEYNRYKTLLTDGPTSAAQRLDASNLYQSNTLYYNYREKNILLGNTVGIWDTTTSLEIILKMMAFYSLQDDGFISSSADPSDYEAEWNAGAATTEENFALYQVKYIPIPESMRINIDREDLSDVSYNSVLLSNQQSRIVNLESFANNVKGRINRIGNSELQLEHRVTSTSDLYVVGDYTNDGFIVTEREIILYKDYIYAKYSLSKNYNMISKFIGVNSEIRQYDIAEQNTLERKLLYSEYIEIEATGSTSSGSSDSKLLTSAGIACIMETLKPTSTYRSVGGGYFRCLTNSGFTDYLALEVSSNGGGGSLIFDFQLPSNNFAGITIDEINNQRAINFATYVDDNGEMESMSIAMFDEIYYDDYTRADVIDRGDSYPFIDQTRVLTKYVENASGYNFTVNKDSAEEIGGTVMFKAVTDPSTVVVGRKFVSRNRLVNNDAPTSIKLYASTTRSLRRYENFKLDTTGFTELTSPIITVDTTNKYVTVSHASLTSANTSWVLTDEDGFVLIGVNQDGVLTNRLTFDFKNKRSGIKYKY